MSTPEWMKKYQEIGQKGDEEVTTPGEEGFVKTAEARRSVKDSAEVSEAVEAAAAADPPGESSSSASSSDGAETGDAADDATGDGDSEMPTTTTDEDVGESWVPDEDKEKRGSESFNPSESFITEEILVDEDGNEILVDESGDEVEEEVEEVEEVEEEEEEEEEELVDESVNDPVPEPEEDASPEEYEPPAPVYNDPVTLPRAAPTVYDVEAQKRMLGVGKAGKSSRMSWFIPLMVFATIVAAVLLVLFLVVYNDDGTLGVTTTTTAPTQAPFDTAVGSVDAAATTEFDAIKNDCSLDSLQPNIIDQCSCGDTIDIIADDVRARWESYVENFIPSIYDQWNEPIDSCAPENQALLWLSSGLKNGGEIDYLIRLQRYILAVVYYSNGGTEWSRSSSWLSDENACGWEGVECNDDLHVRILNLDENNLTGQISAAPTFLNAIEAFFMANNEVIGSVPGEYFGDISLRYLDLSGNELSGELSSDISSDSKLTRLSLASNKLSGAIPVEIGEISGLEILNIGSNAFSGELPTTMFSLPLAELYIGDNAFTGTIPGELTVVSTLTSLTLGPNEFEGDIPSDLSELTALKELSIVGIPDLGGQLPALYGLDLTGLEQLHISGTNIDGAIPYQYSLLTDLKTLRLSDNNLRGDIPPSLSLLTNLENLSLSANDLTGTIPTEMGMLTSVERLLFHSNNLSGTIPEEFGNLLNIKTLTFDNNAMSGRAPSGVCALRDAELSKFIVDCPTLTGESQVTGIVCAIPDCCTECL